MKIWIVTPHKNCSFNPIALRTAKALWSFGCSESNRVKEGLPQGLNFCQGGSNELLPTQLKKLLSKKEKSVMQQQIFCYSSLSAIPAKS